MSGVTLGLRDTLSEWHKSKLELPVTLFLLELLAMHVAFRTSLQRAGLLCHLHCRTDHAPTQFGCLGRRTPVLPCHRSCTSKTRSWLRSEAEKGKDVPALLESFKSCVSFSGLSYHITWWVFVFAVPHRQVWNNPPAGDCLPLKQLAHMYFCSTWDLNQCLRHAEILPPFVWASVSSI